MDPYVLSQVATSSSATHTLCGGDGAAVKNGRLRENEIKVEDFFVLRSIKMAVGSYEPSGHSQCKAREHFDDVFYSERI